ncbi:uncharacterized protein LOC119368918 [Triticum dicoccoides]|uniref:uncharacterized protein LOC119368918 n=1 Tax=Triticum dicoccoides TaxID=85692 RepID=UPI00188F8BE9|nr:uncharacterized protein LOC119368918 [Triticum dicoccoides]
MSDNYLLASSVLCSPTRGTRSERCVVGLDDHFLYRRLSGAECGGELWASSLLVLSASSYVRRGNNSEGLAGVVTSVIVLADLRCIVCFIMAATQKISIL